MDKARNGTKSNVIYSNGYRKEKKSNIYSNIQSPMPVQTSPGYGGGGGGTSVPQQESKEPAPEPEPEVTISNVLTVTSPLNEAIFATTTITFTGTMTSVNGPENFTIFNDFSSSTTTPNQDGDWTIALQNFTQGTTTIGFTFSNQGEATSTASELDVFVDSTLPTFDFFNILECQNSLSQSICLSSSNEINLEWSTVEENLSHYSIFVDGTNTASTTNTTRQITLSGNSLNSIEIVVYDTVGNTATSSSKSVTVSEMPIIINEIAWSGTQASSADEWIELYNRSDYEIDLTNVVLKAEDEVPYINLSGTIPAKNFFLIERGVDDEAVDSLANLAVAFSGVGSGSGLGNSGEVLSLIHIMNGRATTTIDITPILADCGGSWCAGTASSEYRSMERKTPDVDGSLESSWESNNTYKKNNRDKDGIVINGTPGSRNSQNFSESGIGYFCPSAVTNSNTQHSYQEGGYYIPTEFMCTYIFPSFLGMSIYGGAYKGEVGNSTSFMRHLMGGYEKLERDEYILDLVEGDKIFIAVYQISELGHCNAEDCSGNIAAFDDYFTGATSTPPMGLTAPLQYEVLNWIYGTE